MQEIFEKILEKLEELRQEQIEELCRHNGYVSEMQSMRGHNILQNCKKIVQEAAAEYNDGWIPVENGILPKQNEDVVATIVCHGKTMTVALTYFPDWLKGEGMENNKMKKNFYTSEFGELVCFFMDETGLRMAPVPIDITKVLMELSQYRNLGTVEEIKRLREEKAGSSEIKREYFTAKVEAALKDAKKQIEKKKLFFQRWYESEGRTKDDESINKATQLAFDDAIDVLNEVGEKYNIGKNFSDKTQEDTEIESERC